MSIISQCRSLLKTALNNENLNIFDQLKCLLNQKDEKTIREQFETIQRNSNGQMLYFSLLFLLAQGTYLGVPLSSLKKLFDAA